MMLKRSQAAAEMLVILAIGLAVLLTILVINDRIMTGTRGRIELTKARNAVDSITGAAELVYQQGVGARTRVFIDLPDETLSFSASGQTLTMQLYAGGSLNNVYRSLDFNVSGTLPATAGNHWLYVEAKEGYVQISQNITAEVDVTPPTISNVRNGTVTNQSAIILWNTDENADSAVYYGLTESLGSGETDATQTQSHSVTLSGLTNNTLYYYKVGSCDTSSNCANSSINNFTTAQTAGDSTPPASVTDLNNQSAGTTWIYWNWTNPSDADFSQAIIYINSSNVANISDDYYNATGLTADTAYTMTVHTKDTTGNVNNTDVNSTASTLTSVNQPPTHTTPVLNSTYGTNLTTENLTCYNQSTSDADGDSVKNIFNWYKNNAQLMLLNLPFEGGSNSTYTKDYSGQNHDGTVSGATRNSTGGYDSKGTYDFDGSVDYISLPVNDMTAGKSETTVMFWVKPDDWTSGKALWDECDGTYWQFSVYTNAWYTRDSSTGSTGSRNNDLAMPTMLTGEWHHLAFVYSVEESLKAIYVDGVLNTSTSTSVDTLTSNRDFARIADACDGTNFDGKIDDFMIFNESLSAEQIKAVYQNRTDLIVSDETSANDIWQCEVTPNDGTQDGTTLDSNNLTIKVTIDNPSFEYAISAADWTYTELDGSIYNSRSTSWSTNGSYSYRTYVSGSASTGDHGRIYQDIDLTGIDNITFDADVSTSYSACQYAEARVYIDNDNSDFSKDTNWYLDLCSGNNGEHLNQNINVSSFTGNHTLKMELYVTLGTNLGERNIYYDNLRTS
ncbi:MAG: fibronectin type III domain-containing protein [Nanoarchaeota archaeon]|nr:fibronectin type III domain-containing protein [Nanoarchaeota archaeon]